jgi:hypothetical protein
MATQELQTTLPDVNVCPELALANYPAYSATFSGSALRRRARRARAAPGRVAPMIYGSFLTQSRCSSGPSVCKAAARTGHSRRDFAVTAAVALALRYTN